MHALDVNNLTDRYVAAIKVLNSFPFLVQVVV